MRHFSEVPVPSMTRCPNGHFYDSSKGGCPTCARPAQVQGPPPTRPEFAGGSQPPRSAPVSQRAPSPPQPRAQGQPQVTKAIWPQELGTDPIVGWLVAYEGKCAGRDFRLRSGRMRIGRGDNQDVQIDDEYVARENHAFVIYDPLSCEFLVQPGDGRGLVHLAKNKQKPELVAQPQKLSSFDTLIIGKTYLFFVPFCGPNTFQWQPSESKGSSAKPQDVQPEEPRVNSDFSQRKTDNEW